MRRSPSCAARILTIFSLALLCSLSFTVALAHPADINGIVLKRQDGPSGPANPSDTPGPSSSSSSSAPATTPSSSSSAESSISVASTTSDTPSTSPTTSSTIPSTTSTSSSVESSLSTFSSSSSFSSSAPPSSSSSVVTTSSSPPSSSSRPSSSSTLSTTSVSRTTAKAITVIATTTTPANGGTTLIRPSATSLAPATTVSASASASSTPKSFLENKGATAAVFTIVGLAGLGVVVGAAMFFYKRHRRDDEEEDVYFEKYNDPEPSTDMAQVHGSYGTMEPAATEAMAPAAGHDAYPDRTVHYGPSMGQEYDAAYAQNYDHQQYGMEYPPNTAYANATAHEGEYQYHGYDNEQYAAPSAYEPAPVQYEQQLSPTGHPFADSRHAARAGGAPPVSPNPSGYSGDSYYSPQ